MLTETWSLTMDLAPPRGVGSILTARAGRARAAGRERSGRAAQAAAASAVSAATAAATSRELPTTMSAPASSDAG